MDQASIDNFAFVPGRGARIAIERAAGCYLYTPDGREILDAAGGAIVANVGHGRREVAEAVATSLANTSYVVPSFATPERLNLVERLRNRWLPEGLTQIYFSSGGSESIDAATRLALQHFVARGEPQRQKIIGRELSYHGTTLSTLAVGGHATRRQGFEPQLAAWPKAPASYCLRCPQGMNYPSCEVDCATELERLLAREGPETVAAFVAEPIVGSAAGALVPPPEYWPRIAEICRRNGVLLVADEVMTGFGRTGRRFGVDHSGVIPDILVGGKGLAGGYAPLTALATRRDIVEPLGKDGQDLMFYTFGGHPAACAAADTVLDIMEREELVQRAATRGAQLREQLAPLEDHPHVAEVRGQGLLLGVELVADRASLKPFPREAGLATQVQRRGLAEGVFFYTAGSGVAQDAILLGPPFTLGDREIDKIATALPRAIDAAVAKLSAR